MSCTPGAQQLAKIASIVREVEKLSDTEKLLLYLQLPHGRASGAAHSEAAAGAAGRPKGAAANSASAKASPRHAAAAADELVVCAPKRPDNETTLTYTWILSHLEEDPNISLPKQEVYDEYRAFCQASRFEPLCVADFGKAMKHALPCIKPRRLGQRGNSRYCYSGLRKKYRIEAPACADLSGSMAPSGPSGGSGGGGRRAELASPAARGLGAHKPASHQIASGAHQHQQQQQQQLMNEVPSQLAAPAGVLRNMQQTAPSELAAGPYECHRDSSQQQQQLQEPFDATCVPAIKLKTEVACSAESCKQVAAAAAAAAACCGLSAAGPCGVIQGAYDGRQAAQGPPAPAPRQPCVLDYTPSHPQQQQQQQPHNNGQAHATHYQQSYPPRPGTPDDDDYRHNYHDLNRPIIGPAIIPFQQSMSSQMAKQPGPHESFLSYSNTSYGPAPSAGAHSQPNPHPHQQQHQQQQQQQMQQQMHQMICALPACCSISESLATTTLTSAPAQGPESSSAPGEPASSSMHKQQQQQQQQQQPQHHQRSFEGSPAAPVRNHALAHLNLNLNSAEGAEMDFASPFQSPASTPYSSMLSNANYLAQDTQDYYSSAASDAASAGTTSGELASAPTSSASSSSAGGAPADCNPLAYPDFQ